MDIFSKAVIDSFRRLIATDRCIVDERNHLKKELQERKFPPKEYSSLLSYRHQFDDWHKRYVSLVNLIIKMWSNYDAEHIAVTPYPLRYSIIQRYADEKLYIKGSKKSGAFRKYFFIARDDWSAAIMQCVNGLSNDFTPFFKKYWEYRECLKNATSTACTSH